MRTFYHLLACPLLASILTLSQAAAAPGGPAKTLAAKPGAVTTGSVAARPAAKAPLPYVARPALGPKARVATPAAPARTAAPSVTPIKPTLAAPTKDVLNEHFAITVTGSVTNTAGQGLPGATVWLTNTRQVLAVTNAAGQFSLTLPTNAAVALTCGYAGCQEQQVYLTQPQPSNQVAVQLEPAGTGRRR